MDEKEVCDSKNYYMPAHIRVIKSFRTAPTARGFNGDLSVGLASPTISSITTRQTPFNSRRTVAKARESGRKELEGGWW